MGNVCSIYAGAADIDAQWRIFALGWRRQAPGAHTSRHSLDGFWLRKEKGVDVNMICGKFFGSAPARSCSFGLIFPFWV